MTWKYEFWRVAEDEVAMGGIGILLRGGVSPPTLLDIFFNRIEMQITVVK